MSPEQRLSPSRSNDTSAKTERLKAEIFTLWRRLPPEQAAAVMVEQLRDVLAGELGEPLRRALAYGSEDFNLDAGHQQFSIPFEKSSVSRADLRAFLPEEDAAQFDDSDMQRLAVGMAALYADSTFRADLRFLAGLILDVKQNDGEDAVT